MTREIQSALYMDEQDQAPGDFCPICGGERYRPGLRCLRCEGGVL